MTAPKPGNFSLRAYAVDNSYLGYYDLMGEIPINNLTFASPLNDSGSLSNDVPRPLARDDWSEITSMLQLTQPGAVVLVVDMDGTPVWGGINWQRNRQQGDHTTPGTWMLGANEPVSYYDLRQINRNYLGGDTSWTNAPAVPFDDPLHLIQLVMLNARVTAVSGQPGYPGSGSSNRSYGDCGLWMPNEVLGGSGGYVGCDIGSYDPGPFNTRGFCAITPSYMWQFYTTTVASVLQDMTGADGLAEWATAVDYITIGSPAVLSPRLKFVLPRQNLGSPSTYNKRLGQVDPTTGNIMENVNVLDLDICPSPGYTWPEDAKQSANRTAEIGYGLGSNQENGFGGVAIGNSPLIYPLNNPSMFPWLMEQAITQNNMDSLHMLTSFAGMDYDRMKQPVASPSVPIPSAGSPGLLDFGLGDDIPLHCSPNADFPDGIDPTPGSPTYAFAHSWRITGKDTSVPLTGPAITTLTLSLRPVFGAWPGPVPNYPGG